MTLRKTLGIASLALLALSANLLVAMQDPFAWMVVAPLAAGIGCAAAWFIRLFSSAPARAVLEGKAIGGANAVVASLVFLAICIVLFAFVQSSKASWDLTQEGRRALSPQTIQVLKTMTQEVNVICLFLSIDDELVRIAKDKTLRFMGQCEAYTDLIKVEVLDPQIDMDRLGEMGLTHAKMQGTVIIRAGTRQRVITLSGGSPRLEERDFTNALINVLRGAEPKVYFLTGHEEPGLGDASENKGASSLANLLAGESYGLATHQVSLHAPAIPGDCDVLVLFAPKFDLHRQEIVAIQAYLDRGGRLLVLLEPWTSVKPGYSATEILRPWLDARYGVAVGSDIVLSDQQQSLWTMELLAGNAPFEDIDEGFMEYRGSFRLDHVITGSFDQPLMLQAFRTVRRSQAVPKGVFVSEILRTIPEAWAELGIQKFSETRKAAKSVEEDGGPLSIAVAVTVENAGDATPGAPAKPAKPARLVILGDADLALNGRLNVFPGHVNFMLNIFAWLTESEDLIAIRPSGKEEPPLLLSPREERAIVWVSTLLTLQIVAGAGLLTYAARRKHQ